MHKLPSPPKFNRDIELKNERKALTKWGRKKHSPSQKTQENYFLIYAQLYYQAAVTFGDFVVSVWWCCFEYCTSESILYVKIQQWWENPSVPVKCRDALELGFSYKEKKKENGEDYALLCLGKEGVEDIQIKIEVPPPHNNTAGFQPSWHYKTTHLTVIVISFFHHKSIRLLFTGKLDLHSEGLSSCHNDQAASIWSSELYKDNERHFYLSKSFTLLKDMTVDQ